MPIAPAHAVKWNRININRVKRIICFTFILICLNVVSKAQSEAVLFKKRELNKGSFSKEDVKQQFARYNFSKLWDKTPNEFIYGFIGSDYQRIRIKFITITKGSSSNSYLVYGKSMVKTNISDFKGTIEITDILKLKSVSKGVDDVHKNEGIKGQFIILGNYTFAEPNNQSHAGVFKGSFKSNFYLDKNDEVHYDDIDQQSDSFTNNEFVGAWNPYNNGLSKRCNWGDYRIPNGGNLDGGAGEFSPVDKYLHFGWQNKRDAFGDDAKAKQANAEEQANWWK